MKNALLLFLCLALFSCKSRMIPPSSQTAKNSFKLSQWDEWTSFQDKSHIHELKQALKYNIRWLKKRSEKDITVADITFPRQSLLPHYEKLLDYLESESTQLNLAQYLQEHFVIYKSVGRDGKGEVMSTGYFLPHIEGQFERDDEYSVPVYGIPEDLVKISLSDFGDDLPKKTLRGRIVQKDPNRSAELLPYWTREEIREKNTIEDKAEVIAWVKDRVQLFFMEIQGSGIMVTPDGTTYTLGYAEQNGQAYKAIGKLLLDEKIIPREKMSLESIQSYLRKNPDDMERVLYYNPSFIFFQKLDSYARGNLNFPVTPLRTVAADQRIFFPGSLLLYDMKVNKAKKEAGVYGQDSIQRLVLVQDTGGAIKGAGRIDYFWGHGEKAKRNASGMEHKGKLGLLIPKEIFQKVKAIN